MWTNWLGDTQEKASWSRDSVSNVVFAGTVWNVGSNLLSGYHGIDM